MFKKILREIVQIRTMEEFNHCCGEISRAFETGKVSWNDYNLLFSVAELAGKDLPEMRNH